MDWEAVETFCRLRGGAMDKVRLLFGVFQVNTVKNGN